MKVHRNQSVRPVRVTTDGEGLVSWHTHDSGIVLTHMAVPAHTRARAGTGYGDGVAIADGADCLSHLAVFAQPGRTVRPGGVAVHARNSAEVTACTAAMPSGLTQAMSVAMADCAIERSAISASNPVPA